MGAVLACAALAACGAPPDLGPAQGTGVPVPPTGSPAASAGPPTGAPVTPTGPPTTPPPLSPSPSGFPETYAVSCGGEPSGERIVRLLRRRAGLLPSGVRATVDTGPLCSGTWQYTVVVVPGREPLAVVTRTESGTLRLVTAGTNVCSIPVRTEAPIGIRTAAAC